MTLPPESGRPVGWGRSESTWLLYLAGLLSTLVVGVGLTLAFRLAGLLWTAALLVPTVLAICAAWLYLLRTRATIAELKADAVERERVEQQLNASLRKKVMLLQEIHHRVKNNLQIMSSLLYLQSTRVEDEGTRRMLKESESRIRSMALVHEQLYQSADLSAVDFAQYIRTLAAHLFRSYAVDSNVVSLEIGTDPVPLSIESAMPVGLIVHELLTNSLKYAFPNGRRGSVRIELKKTDDGEIHLAIGDNGVGFSSGSGPGNAESLGLNLVRTLIEQLEGTLELDRSSGTNYQIAFADGPHPDGGAP